MDDTKHKKKKHKKHKKSKKEAITLDQFLNMNTDVFGEGLDFQGVEEVHSQSIAKRLKKPVRKTAQSKLPPDIEKLKRQGIVIKKKKGTTPITPLVFKANTIVNKTPIPTAQTKTSLLATPDDVLTKLINQNNSQIKIVKKSNAETKTVNEDFNEMQCASPAVDNEVPLEDAEPNGTKSTLTISKENVAEDSTKTDDQETKNNTNTIKSPNLDEKKSEFSENDDGEESNHSQSILDEIRDGDDDVQTEKKSKIVDKLTALRNNSNIVIKSNQQTVPDLNKVKEAVSHDSDGNISNHEEDEDPDVNGDISNKNDSLNALKHLSHLTVKSCNHEQKPISKLENTRVEKNEITSEVSKIAHLIKSSPAKFVVNTVKNSTPVVPQSNTPLKAKPESEESNVDTEDETHEHDSDNITEPVQSGILTSILNSPHLNIQPIKRSPKVPPQNVTPPVESLPNNDKSSADLLKHLKNVTAKPVVVNKTVNVSASSPKLSPKLINTVRKEPDTVPVKHSKVIQDDIEIFNIDDSDSDEANSNTVQNNKTDIKETPTPIKSSGVLKNLNKNITIKSFNNHKPDTDTVKDVKEFDSDDDEDADEDKSHHTPLPSNSRNISISNSPINQKQSALNNVLKNLSKNITVKSGNSSPAHFSATAHDQNSQNSNSAHEDEGADSETDSLSGRVRITEMNDLSDEEFHKDTDKSDNVAQDNVNVQYPDDSNSDNEDRNHNEELDENFSDEDIEKHITANALKKIPISKPNLDSFKNVCKDLVIKLSGQTTRTPQLTSSDEIPPFAKSLSNRISIKSMKQADNCNTQVKTNNAVFRNAEQSKSAINQNIASSSNQVNTVNKEVKTVKTFQTQTQTVIQEITTTVTKTIKTVNQSMKQEMRNTAQSISTPRKVQQINANNINIQGTKVRQTAPMVVAGPRIRNPGIRPTRPMLPATIRPSNQLVPVRPRCNAPRQSMPRMSSVRPSTSGQLRPKIGAQVKLAPGVVTTAGKRANIDTPGHFSCFKKTKESLFPEADFTAMNKQEGETSVQFSSTMQMSKSNFASSSKTVKGNSVVTSSQMKSEMNASSQHLGKLRNLSGLSVVKTSQANQSHVEEKSEVSVAKQNTLDAIQKLQNQGLLVKKPRLASEESEHSNPGDMEHFSDEEFDS